VVLTVELFRYLELRAELLAEDHERAAQSDTATLRRPPGACIRRRNTVSKVMSSARCGRARSWSAAFYDWCGATIYAPEPGTKIARYANLRRTCAAQGSVRAVAIALEPVRIQALPGA